MALRMLEPGTTVEKYEILEDLGAGGMARVFKVRHTLLGSLHALKVLEGSLLANGQVRKRFLAEGQIQAQVRHPNIAQVTDVIIQPGVAGLVVELVPGQSLDDWVAARTHPPTVGEIKQLFLPLLDGLGYAHSNGVIHRDIKPANIIVDAKNGSLNAKIVDFGIAKIVDEAFGGNAAKARTKTGARMGTPNYMSPEQIRGVSYIDARSDIFSLAATLYEVVTLTVPFDGPSEFEVMRRIVDGDLTPVRQLRANVDPIVNACIAKGMQSERDNRFESCGAFAELLERVGSGLTTAGAHSVRPPPLAPQSPIPVVGVDGPATKTKASAPTDDPAEANPKRVNIPATVITAVCAGAFIYPIGNMIDRAFTGGLKEALFVGFVFPWLACAPLAWRGWGRFGLVAGLGLIGGLIVDANRGWAGVMFFALFITAVAAMGWRTSSRRWLVTTAVFGGIAVVLSIMTILVLENAQAGDLALAFAMPTLMAIWWGMLGGADHTCVAWERRATRQAALRETR